MQFEHTTSPFFCPKGPLITDLHFPQKKCSLWYDFPSAVVYAPIHTLLWKPHFLYTSKQRLFAIFAFWGNCIWIAIITIQIIFFRMQPTRQFLFTTSTHNTIRATIQSDLSLSNLLLIHKSRHIHRRLRSSYRFFTMMTYIRSYNKSVTVIVFVNVIFTIKNKL